jgi:pimeloyl-ACP methyl ester carboxylesterase
MKKLLKYQDASIYYDVIGEGRPVVLVHGFGEDREVWRKQSASLSGEFKLIIPDLPGTGESEMTGDMSIEGMAEVIHAVMVAENTGPCPVIGHSMGGYITLALAEKYPDQCTAIGLFHSSAFADSEEKKASRRKGMAFIKEHSAQEFLKTMIPTLFAPAEKGEKQEFIGEQLARIHNFSADTLVSYYQAMIDRPDRTGVLRKSTVPVMFMMGKSDAAVPVEDSLKQCHLPGISYIHMLYQSGHMGMLEEAEKSNTLLKEFLMDLKFNF